MTGTDDTTIFSGDSLNVLRTMPDESVDAVITDPPYGYSFMGKDWDKAVPSVDIWRECLRVLKPGGWCMVMSAPRSDVQNAMISRLMEAGFRLDFTPIYWTYASGFPKAGNVGKLIDRRLGVERELIDSGETLPDVRANNYSNSADKERLVKYTSSATSDQAKALDGSYTGFQPKPAVEVIIVAMKPLSEKTYVDQALKNGKGITWLDDCRVPGNWEGSTRTNSPDKASVYGEYAKVQSEQNPQGRFPANLLVSDQALNGHSKYFDLDAWADTLPFLAVPKASKSEKNKGLTDTNVHPTVKPLKLMSYLITLTTREGDTVLDPFVGSGTTAVAAKQLGRIGIGIEREIEYATIAAARVAAAKKTKPEPEQTSLL